MPVSSVSKLACGFVLKRARQRIIDNDGALAFVLYAEAELAEGEGPRVVAEFSDYAGMLDALRFFQKIGGLGAQARIDNSTKAQRQQWARHAANTRWAKE